MPRIENSFRFLVFLLGVGFTSATLGNLSAGDIEYYSKFSEYWKLRISPDGRHLAVGAWKDGRRIAVILERDGLKPKLPVFFTNSKEEVGDFYWASSERLVVGVARYNPSETTRSFFGGELYAVNVDGRKADRIFTYRSESGRKKKNSGIAFGGYAVVEDALEDDPRQILIRACGFSEGSGCSLYDLDIFNSRLRNERPLPPRTTQIIFNDGTLEPAFAIASTSRGDVLVHVLDEEGFWREIDSYETPGGALIPVLVSGETVFALDDRDGKNQALVKVDRNLNNRELVYRHDFTDVMGIHSDDQRSVYGVDFGVGQAETYFLRPDHEDAKALNSLKQVFPNYDVDIVDSASEGRLLVVATSSDRAPPAYYLFDRDKRELQYLISQRPWVDETLSASTLAFTFEARDGLGLSALVTLPQDYGEETPLVVMPHGGPHGPFDTWDYDTEAQYLAHLGMATLKVNFRGSGGFGGEFLAKGFREWGRKIQLDLVDGARHTVSRFGLHPSNIGIMGGSFGGYSALQASIVEPELFKAAVGVVGVYDFSLMYREGDIRSRFSGRRYLEKAIGRDEEEFRRYSPVLRADELIAPVLLIQGEKDERAPVEHADVMAKVLEELNHPYQYVIMPNEDHGFYKPENRVRYFELFGDFLTRHLIGTPKG